MAINFATAGRSGSHLFMVRFANKKLSGRKEAGVLRSDLLAIQINARGCMRFVLRRGILAIYALDSNYSDPQRIGIYYTR